MSVQNQPRHVLVFGGGGRIGGAVIQRLRYLAPDLRLRIATSRTDSQAELTRTFPEQEVVLADFGDEASMTRCFADVDAAFLVTPNFLDEAAAMSRIAAAVRANTDFRQLFRVVGDLPGITPARLPPRLQDRLGPAMQHRIARATLEDAGVPTAYLNIAGLMSNLFANASSILAHGVVAQPPRIHGWIDTGDVGELAARLILSGDERHVGQTYDLDNNHDVLHWSEVVEMLSSTLMRPVAYDPTPEGFLTHVGPIYRAKMNREDAPEYFLEYFTLESQCDPAWRRTDFVERVLGRRPKTLRAWIEQNAATFTRS